MNPLVIVQTLAALAALAGQLTPLILQLKAAVEAQDETQVTALLAKLQAVNDQLGVA